MDSHMAALRETFHRRRAADLGVYAADVEVCAALDSVINPNLLLHKVDLTSGHLLKLKTRHLHRTYSFWEHPSCPTPLAPR